MTTIEKLRDMGHRAYFASYRQDLLIAAVELEALQNDKARLDWLIENSVNDDSAATQNNGEVLLQAATRIPMSKLREAIDRAMKGEK